MNEKKEKKEKRDRETESEREQERKSVILLRLGSIFLHATVVCIASKIKSSVVLIDYYISIIQQLHHPNFFCPYVGCCMESSDMSKTGVMLGRDWKCKCKA